MSFDVFNVVESGKKDSAKQDPVCIVCMFKEGQREDGPNSPCHQRQAHVFGFSSFSCYYY
jgi:hypothetical protein